MKIKCKRESLLTAFQSAAAVAPARSPKPVLQNVKVEARSEETILMATDLELGIRVAAEDVEVETPGAAVLPVTRFGSLLRENSDEQLSIVAEANGIVIQGERSEFHMPAQNPDEFPSVEKFDQEEYFEVPGSLFRDLVRRTLFATDTESSRYALGGVLLEFHDGAVIAVGTDGRRLAKMEGDVQVVGEYSGSDSVTIVPSKSMQLMDRALVSGTDAVIQIVTRPNDLLIRSTNTTIYSRLVDGRFPKWREVIPSARDGIEIALTAGPVLSALRQASIVASEDSRGINFSFGGGTLVLSGRTADVGESRVELPIDYDGPEIVLTLDHRYVADFLKVLDPDKTFKLDVLDADSAALCGTDDGYSYVLMPLAHDKAAKSA